MPDSAPPRARDGRANWQSPRLAIPDVFLLLFAADFPYHYAFRQLPAKDNLCATAIDAVLFTAILWMTTCRDLARVSLLFLALPYLVFIPGWLNLPSVAVLLPLFVFCLATTLRDSRSISQVSVTAGDILPFVLVIAWVNLSGAGGYGHQTADYIVHNARLKDLIDYTWPVHYGVDQNFISYFGYFLPAAILGKLSTTDIAFRSMYPWTVLGVTLALRWLGVLSGWRFSAGLVLVFILFGPIDSLNVFVLGLHSNIPLNSSIAETLVNSDYLDFRAGQDVGFYIGNYLSNTFQLFWSPHQVIAGWIAIGLLTQLFFTQKIRQFVFVYALLCLWSPLIMIALFPFVLCVAWFSLRDQKVGILFSVENTLGAGALALVFIAFYLGVNAASFPSRFLWQSIAWKQAGWVLALFYPTAWGLYALLQWPVLAQQPQQQRCWFYCLVIALLALSLRKFGAYSDLLCRGSAPLMFLLLAFILRSLKQYWQQKQFTLLLALCILLALGSGSALLQLRNAITLYGGDKPLPQSLIHYTYSEENLGRDDTWFNRYLRRHP